MAFLVPPGWLLVWGGGPRGVALPLCHDVAWLQVFLGGPRGPADAPVAPGAGAGGVFRWPCVRCLSSLVPGLGCFAMRRGRRVLAVLGRVSVGLGRLLDDPLVLVATLWQLLGFGPLALAALLRHVPLGGLLASVVPPGCLLGAGSFLPGGELGSFLFSQQGLFHVVLPQLGLFLALHLGFLFLQCVLPGLLYQRVWPR